MYLKKEKAKLFLGNYAFLQPFLKYCFQGL